MKIERLYSNYQEERLYSTGNDELDELLERAFCDGYEYAQKEFGKEDRKRRKERDKRLKELGVKWGDRQEIKSWDKSHQKGHTGYFTYDSYKKRNSEDPDVRKEGINEQMKRHLPASAATLGLYGGVTRFPSNSRLKSAAIGTAIGAGAAGLGGGIAHLESNHVEKHPNSKAAKRFEKNRDMIKVVEGDMSEEEYAKKYGKKK